jgi:hypothetical protein
MIGPDALKDPVAIEQTVVKHGDFGLPFIQKFTINKNFHI